MTLRTIESEFTQALMKQQFEDQNWDLTLEAPLMASAHPRIIRARLEAEIEGKSEFSPNEIPGWNYEPFHNTAEALKKFPDALTFRGLPFQVGQFLEKKDSLVAIEFDELGTIVLSKNEIQKSAKNDLHTYSLATWTNYALSPELWGPIGKWTRFHERLSKLFHDTNLQDGNCRPGYYTLKSSASLLKDHGFTGTNLDKSYLLVLPWMFSLSALEKLERIVRQEF